MTTTYLSWCEKVNGHPSKQGYQGIPNRTLGNIKGEVKHSAEGSYAALLAAVKNPGRIASWHFSVSKTGHVAQHYPLESVCWHAGNMQANIQYVGIEHEGVVGEPLTVAQVLATVHLSLDIRRFAGITAPPARHINLWEHNWISATACPSNRIPWALIINKIKTEEHKPKEDEDMPLNTADLAAIRKLIKEETDSKRVTVKLKGKPFVWHIDLDGGRLVHDLNLTTFGKSGSTFQDVIELDPNNKDHAQILALPVLFPKGLVDLMQWLK